MTLHSPKTMTPGGRRAWGAVALALAALAWTGPAAHAAPVQFAQFAQSNNNPFSFTNNAGSSGSLGYNVGSTVIFNFTAATGLDTSDRVATVFLSGTTTAPATTSSFLGMTLVDQPINNISSLTLIENSTGKTLLSMMFTGDITGILASNNADLKGSTDNGKVVTFTSDYLTFGSTGNSFVIGLPTVAPTLSVGAGGFLNSFVSNAFGSFTGSINVIPQPTSVAMLGTGFVATLVLAARRNRSARRTPGAA